MNIVIIMAVLLAFFALYRRTQQRSIFTNKPYEVGFTFGIATGRGCDPVTPSKAQALRNQGFTVVGEYSDRPKMIVPGMSFRDALHKARDAAIKNGLLLLW